MAPGCTIGVDIGGTKLLAAWVDGDGRMGARVRRQLTGLGREELLDEVAAAVSEIAAGAPVEVESAGFGIPALIDYGTGEVVFSNHLPLAGVRFGQLMRDRIGLPVAVDNDANCAVLAEWRSGAAAGMRDVVLLTLGTGVGGGVVLAGAVYRGSTGAAAELGHVVVDYDGPPCFGACPGRGCLEALASGSALERDAAAAVRDRPDSRLAAEADASGRVAGEAVTALALGGDPLAQELVGELGRRLGAGLAGLAMAFAPEAIVIGGGLCAAGELLLGPAREELRSRAHGPAREAMVVPAALGDEAGMVGAALLAAEAAA